MFLVSRWTLQRRVHEYELQEVTGYWTISDEQLDNIVECFMRDHGTLVILWFLGVFAQGSTRSN